MPTRSALAVLSAALIALGGCGPAAPTDAWNANLDANCEPQDPVDRTLAALSGTKFWTQQVKDMASFVKAARTNLKNSQDLLDLNLSGRAKFRTIAVDKARDLGLQGAKADQMVNRNMRDFDAQSDRFRANIASAKIEQTWAERCLGVAQTELANQ